MGGYLYYKMLKNKMKEDVRFFYINLLISPQSIHQLFHMSSIFNQSQHQPTSITYHVIINRWMLREYVPLDGEEDEESRKPPSTTTSNPYKDQPEDGIDMTIMT